MRKKILTIATCLTLGGLANAQNVNIPDANFKNALLAHGASAPVNGVNPITGAGISLIDANNDGDISTTEAQNYTGTIQVNSRSISDLTGIEAFVNLTKLDCNNNQLTSIDISANTALTYLHVSDNQLSSLNVSANTALRSLYCNDNQLTSLDVSADTALEVLYCNNNNLTSLNVANGNNGTSYSNLWVLNALNNPNLTCIQHDTGFDPTTATNWSKDATAQWSSTPCPPPSCTNIVNIPDVNFKAALIGHGTTNIGTGVSIIDTDGDGEICETEASSYTGTLLLSNMFITDLTGIEVFTSATVLRCGNNLFTSVDLSSNISLTSIDIRNNQLTVLDVSSNVALTDLDCRDNLLENLNVANGNNGGSVTNLNEVDARNNPDACIQHDVGFSVSSYPSFRKDQSAFWSENCSAIFVSSITVQGQGGVSTITSPGGTLQMEATILPANADDMTYTWLVSNVTGMATIDANGLLTASQDGTVTVHAVANDGAGALGSATITITNQSASINENNISFSIVPNPTNGMVKIDTEVKINSVEVYSLSGQRIASFDTKAFDISSLQSGVYFVKIHTDNNVFSNRIVKK